jgi:hypothetical protein
MDENFIYTGGFMSVPLTRQGETPGILDNQGKKHPCL